MQTSFENYNETSKSYDQTRTPIGLESILGCLALNPLPLSEQVILDGGCGTGNYIHALLDKLKYIYGLEVNEGMLSQARQRLETASNVRLDQGSLLAIPYGDNMFDGLIVNQVIHHLTDRQTGGFSNICKLLSEAYRTLKPDGVLIINTSSQKQLLDGYWWADLIPEAMGRVAQFYPPIPQLNEMLSAAGFELGSVIVPMREALQGPNYFDPRGPLDASYRAGDSTWALATPTELDRAIQRTQRKNDEGTMTQYIAARDKLRQQIGQTTFVSAIKR
jgi:ubiquinone/menaquinone biosynthesis C-methylase UbiE